MLLALFAFLIGLILLVWSADRFVAHAATLAYNLGISPMAIGLTIVALGTSAPEIVVSAIAALQGSTPLALGNAQGSNIANIGLVLGVVLLMAAVPVNREIMGRQSLMLLLAMAFLGVALHNFYLSRIEAIALLLGLVAFIAWTVQQARADKALAAEAAASSQEIVVEESGGESHASNMRTWWGLAYGLLLLLLAAQALVWGATTIARELGVSELVIGATLVAIGTSLPELATSISSTLKRQHGMTLGNILGSNVFNIFAVIGVAGIISPDSFDTAVFWRDFVFLALTGAALLALIRFFGARDAAIPRWMGLILLAIYLYYLFMNYQAMYA